MELTTHGDFGSGSELLSQHEAASIVGRNDVNLLLNRNVENGEMSQDMAHAFARDAHSRFSISQLRDFAQGATYVCFADMIAIHLFESSVDQAILVRDDRPGKTTRQIAESWVNRSLSTRINILQTEDSTGYGTQFSAVSPFHVYDVPTALTWAIF